MRVVYLLAASAIGGGNQSFMTLWSGLKKHGVTPVVVCPARGGMVQACQERGITCIVEEFHQPSWRQPLRSWQAYRRWRRFLQDHQADLVHANDLNGARSISPAAWKTTLPLVCHIRFPPAAEYVKWAFRHLPKPDLFLFNSRAVQAQAGGTLAATCPHARQQVIYNAVDLEGFRRKPTQTGLAFRIGIIANLSPIKGHDDFLTMARRLLDGDHSCEFWIVGEDITKSGFEKKLAAQARGLGLSGQVKFLGFRSDMSEVLNQLDLVVSCSHYETFGRSLIEAMACELPVVATAVGGMPEVVDHGKTGLLVPAGNPEAMARAVETLVHNENLRREMGRAGRARVEALFASDAHAQQVYTAYESLGKAGSRGGVRPAA